MVANGRWDSGGVMMATNRSAVCVFSVAFACASTLVAGTAQAQSCLSSARSSEKASASERDYFFDAAGHAVDARGVTWSNIADHALSLEGDADGCWSGGRIDGPYPENAVYECSSGHGYTGGTCWAYHISAGMSPNDGKRTVEDLHIKDYGDGISVESGSGDIVGRRIWFENLHDDSMESDYAQQSLSCHDCLFDKVNMVLAYNRRSSVSSGPKSGLTMELRDSLVRLHRFTNTYKQKPGHGGVYKDDDGFSPRFIVTDNVFLLGPVSTQMQIPTPSTTVECRNNLLLWQGTLAAYNDMLDSGESNDGLTNGERLAALSHCYTVIVKPASQSAAAFLAQRWDPLVSDWKASHAAAGGTPTPDPDPDPTPEPDPDPDPVPVPGAPQEPILLP
jgi:hypothetical protein